MEFSSNWASDLQKNIEYFQPFQCWQNMYLTYVLLFNANTTLWGCYISHLKLGSQTIVWCTP